MTQHAGQHISHEATHHTLVAGSIARTHLQQCLSYLAQRFENYI